MRRPIRSIFDIAVLLASIFVATAASAETIRVAVASNFITTLEPLAKKFEQASGHTVTIVPGATGKLYAQIIHGAPFDLFLAADRARPEKLEQDKLAVAGSRRTYAIGRLVLWSAVPSIRIGGPDILKQADFHHLTIANPKLAPYGRAAKETLTELGLWETLRKKLVRGENIAQTYRYVHDRVAEIGFVALSQIRRQKTSDTHFWLVPKNLHAPIEQQMVALNDRTATRAFFDWLRGDAAKRLIEQHGYEVP